MKVIVETKVTLTSYVEISDQHYVKHGEDIKLTEEGKQFISDQLDSNFGGLYGNEAYNGIDGETCRTDNGDVLYNLD